MPRILGYNLSAPVVIIRRNHNRLAVIADCADDAIWSPFDPRKATNGDTTQDGIDRYPLAEAERARRDNLLVVRSVYRQPFGVFSGELPGDVVLAEGFGVMEAHDAWW